jgi:hypothetical protein
VPLVVTGPAAVAWAASDGGSSIEPVQLQAAPLRSTFTYELGPEKHVADAVVVKNSTATSQTFELYAADGYDTADSDVFALRSATQPKLEVGAWVHLPSASVTVPAHSSIRVPFSLSVPAHVSPGDHMGGIVALDEEPTAVTGNGSHLLVRTGVGVRILVRVPGRLRPGLSVTAVRVSGSVPPLSFLSGSSRATVRVGLANTGNTVLSGVLHVAATDSFGRTVARLAPVRFDALLPGARATLVVPPWKHLPVLGPTIGVHVKVDANMTTASAVARFHDVPWVLLAVVLAGVLALGAAVSRVQRRRRATARTTSQSDHVDDTANPGVPVVVATIDRSLLVCEVNPRRAGHSRRRRPSTCGRPDRRKKHGDGTGCAGTQAQGPGGLSATAPTRRHPRRGPSRRPARRSTGMRRRSVQTARRMPLRSKKVLAPLLIALAIVVPMAIFVSDASAATVTWTLIASPDQSAGSPPAATANTLTDLAAVSANDVWAVGSYNAGTSSAPLAQTLVEHYDGTSWSVVSSPNQLNVNNAVTSNELLAVSADSADDVWAVGTYEDLDSSDNPIAQTLVEHYDGTSWSVVSSPDDSAGSPPAPTDNTLSGIVALSAADVWAVGSYNAGTSSAPIAQTLVEHYDGTSWSVVASPDDSTGSPPAPTDNTLSGIVALSANDVWAVGSYNAGTSSAPLAQTLVEHYDGTSWSVVSSPNQLNVNNAVTSNELLAVSADSADDVWAVGTYEDLDSSDNPIAQTLVEHYDGTSWSVVSSPDDSAGSPPAPTDNTLSGIVALSAADVWAVGSYNAGTSSAPIAQTLVEHYDGTSWSVVASADASSAQDNALAQVAAVSSGDLWAVGSANFVSGTQTVSQTLIEGTPASSTTTITASANPSVVGQQVVLTATVAGSSTFVPGGNVSFTDDGTPIEGCSEVTLAAGIATCDDVFANPATHAISVSYGGDDNFLPSGASFSQTVDQAATTTTVTVSPTSAVVGQSLTLAATVAPSAPGAGTPTGAVSFLDDDAPISGCQSVTLSSDMAACATAVDTAATHTLSAVYGGDANFTTSTSSGLPLNVAADATTTSLSSSADPSLAGEPVTYVATVVPAAPGGGTPTGSVAFEDSTTVIAGCGAAALSSGVATCNTIYTLDAAHTITAVYTGSADYVGSTSPALTQTVGSGALSLSDNTGSSFAVDLSPVTFASAQFLAATGQLNTVQVNDNRGTEGGWSVTAQLESNFTNSQPSGAPADNTIPADFLTWVPDVPTAIDGASLSGVSAGNTSTLSDTTAVALCSAVQGSGGSGYNCGASLSLSVPPYVATGTYFATLDIVVTSN